MSNVGNTNIKHQTYPHRNKSALMMNNRMIMFSIDLFAAKTYLDKTGIISLDNEVICVYGQR